MKSAVIFDEYHEVDLKPSALLQEYILLIQQDVKKFLIQDKKLMSCACPACHEQKTNSTFNKFGLNYVECASCGSLYVTPRPLDIDIDRYWRESLARKFFREQLAPSALIKRKEKIIKPRIEWIAETTQEYLPGAKYWVDIDTMQDNYLEAMSPESIFKQKTLLNPFLTLQKNPPHQVDVVSMFEVLNRASNVTSLFEQISSMLKKGGLCFVTAILASGFDLQILWDQSDHIYPPDRLNMFTVEGLQTLFKRHHFECLEFSTPGILDVDIVARALQQEVSICRFVNYLLKNRGEEVKKHFQNFLQESLLSSYGRIVLRKV